MPKEERTRSDSTTCLTLQLTTEDGEQRQQGHDEKEVLSQLSGTVLSTMLELVEDNKGLSLKVQAQI